MKRCRLTFLCFTIYQLNVAFYYAVKVKRPESEYVLIWNNFTNWDVDINLYKKPFDDVILIKNYENGPVIPRQIKKCIAAGRLFFLSKLGNYYKNPRSKEILICFSDQHTLTHRFMNEIVKTDSHEIILIEEGMKTYMGETPISLRNNLVNLCLGLRTEEYIGKSHLINTIIVKSPDMLPEKKREGRKIIKQNDIFLEEEWQKDIVQHARKYLLHLEVNRSVKPVILWLGQPLETDGISEEVENRILHNLVSKISPKAFVYIKAHPREKADKYDYLKECTGVEVVDLKNYSWMPVEMIAKVLNPDVIMSAYSSATPNVTRIIPGSKGLFTFPLFKLNVDREPFEKLCTGINCYITDSIESAVNHICYKATNTKEIVNDSNDVNYLVSAMNLNNE